MSVSRRKFYTIVGLLIGFILYWAWPTGVRRYRNLPPSATGPWVAFGDSLTQGHGAKPGADFPTQLSERLGIPIQNLGVAGETSADGLRRIEAVVNLNPRVVLLCFGGNDVLQSVPRNQMFANIGTMIDRLQKRGSFVLLLGIRGPSLVGDANAKGFKDLANRKRVKLVPDILDGILGQPALMSDYVHPNDSGYGRIAERLDNELQASLAKLRTKDDTRVSGVTH